MSDKPFYATSIDGVEYRFRKPDISQVDRFLSRMVRSPLSAALDLCKELALDPHWDDLISQRPGVALSIANAIMEKLGFQNA